jgi:hypothetical protein
MITGDALLAKVKELGTVTDTTHNQRRTLDQLAQELFTPHQFALIIQG